MLSQGICTRIDLNSIASGRSGIGFLHYDGGHTQLCRNSSHCLFAHTTFMCIQT